MPFDFLDPMIHGFYVFFRRQGILFVAFVWMLLGESPGLTASGRIDYDVLLKVTPIRVKALDSAQAVDAVEIDMSRPPTAIVFLRINRTLKGKFTRLKVGGPSKLDQAVRAAKDRQIVKLVTLDFSDPAEEFDVEWLAVAVADPRMSFGISNWDQPLRTQTKLYLKKVPENPKSWYVVKTEMVS